MPRHHIRDMLSASRKPYPPLPSVLLDKKGEEAVGTESASRERKAQHDLCCTHSLSYFTCIQIAYPFLARWARWRHDWQEWIFLAASDLGIPKSKDQSHSQKLPYWCKQHLRVVLNKSIPDPDASEGSGGLNVFWNQVLEVAKCPPCPQSCSI